MTVAEASEVAIQEKVIDPKEYGQKWDRVIGATDSLLQKQDRISDEARGAIDRLNNTFKTEDDTPPAKFIVEKLAEAYKAKQAGEGALPLQDTDLGINQHEMTEHGLRNMTAGEVDAILNRSDLPINGREQAKNDIKTLMAEVANEIRHQGIMKDLEGYVERFRSDGKGVTAEGRDRGVIVSRIALAKTISESLKKANIDDPDIVKLHSLAKSILGEFSDPKTSFDESMSGVSQVPLVEEINLNGPGTQDVDGGLIVKLLCGGDKSKLRKVGSNELLGDLGVRPIDSKSPPMVTTGNDAAYGFGTIINTYKFDVGGSGSGERMSLTFFVPGLLNENGLTEVFDGSGTITMKARAQDDGDPQATENRKIKNDGYRLYVLSSTTRTKQA